METSVIQGKVRAFHVQCTFHVSYLTAHLEPLLVSMISSLAILKEVYACHGGTLAHKGMSHRAKGNPILRYVLHRIAIGKRSRIVTAKAHTPSYVVVLPLLYIIVSSCRAGSPLRSKQQLHV